MVNQSRPHLLRDLNANSAISLQNDFAFHSGARGESSELLRDLTANDICIIYPIVSMLFVMYVSPLVSSYSYVSLTAGGEIPGNDRAKRSGRSGSPSPSRSFKTDKVLFV